MRTRFFVALALVLLWAGCDRGMAPFDPAEQPATPDLAKIFPDQAALRAAPAQGDAAPSDQASTTAPDGAPVRGQIRIAEGLAGQVPGAALLFIIARSSGAGPPLAVKRIEVPTFPYEFEVSAADRMIAERPFAGPFTLSAWIDTDGNVMTRGVGDFQGQAEGSYAPGDEAILITIDEAL